jgi:glycosyltransferase involved in cell wall biosynthesis
MTVNYMAKFGASERNLPVRLLKAEQRIAAMFADHLFCADHNQQDYLIEHCGIAREKITVLMNLPNTRLFGAMVPKEQSTGRPFRIVYHGTIAHRLGIDLMLRAMEKVTAEIPAELWIYGTGDYLPEVLELSTKLGLDSRVHFSRSFFPVERIREIVSGMDLGVVGNRRNLACDQFMLPVKLLEYVYLGVPVVAPRLSIIQRYFDDTMIRFYEPENEQQMAAAIVELYRSKDQRERQTQAAASFYQRHNMRAQAEQYLNLLSTPKTSCVHGPSDARDSVQG